MKTQFGSRLPRIAWASFGRHLGALLLALALATTFSRPAQAVGTFISAPYRVDHIHDTKRNVIYISSQNSILRYSVDAGAFLPPIQLSGSLGGIDLSPDGDTLAVANRTSSGTATGATTCSIYLINLVDGTSRTVTFPLSRYEHGIWTLAYGNDGRLLISSRSQYNESIPLRRYAPATGETTLLAPVRPQSMLCASANRSLIAFAEPSPSYGSWGTYLVSDGTIVRRDGLNDTLSYPYEIGTTSAGSQLAIPTSNGTFIYNSSSQKLATIGSSAGGHPIGVAYHPFQPKIYFPWGGTGQVRVFDPTTFQQTESYDFETSFDTNVTSAFGNGRAKVTRGGSFLSVSVTGGVRFMALNPLTANPQSVSVVENGSVGITLTASNVAPGTGFSFSIVSGPLHGTLSTDVTRASNYRLYTPTPGYYGPDSFVFQVTNNNQTSQAKVSIAVVSANGIPYAEDSSASTTKDASVSIRLPANDGTNTALTYSFVGLPAYGTVTMAQGTAPGTAIYKPNSGYSGPDSFTWKASDGVNESNTATVSITVINNYAPRAINNGYRTPRETAITVAAPGVLNNDFDPDGDAIKAVLETQTQYGQVALSANGSFTWTPPAPGVMPSNHFAVYFTYRATDATGQSTPATVQILQNDKPIAASQSVSTDEDTALPITLTATDRDSLTYRIVGAPKNGTLSGTAPKLTYTPTANWSGADSFTFVASDGQLVSDPATVSISVNSANDAPVASAQSISTDEDTAKTIELAASDADGDALTYTLTKQPQRGTLSGTAPNLTYTPAENYSGADSFAFKASDGQLDSAEAEVLITVNPINDAPIATPQTLSGDEDTALDIVLGGSDIEGDALTFSVTTQPKHGTLSGDAPNLTYTPDADYFGSDSFAFQANDGALNSEAATISINLRGSSDTPRAVADAFSVDEDQTLSIPAPGVLFNDSDPDRDELTAILVTQPAHGSVVLRADGSFLYTPDADYSGTDEFSYKASDGVLQSAAVKVSLEVKPVNDAPVATAQSISTILNTSKAITLTGSDAEGSTLTYSVVSPPTSGTLSGTAPNLTYTPKPLFFGSDSFSFRVSDGELDSAPATVSITVHALPTATLGAATTLEERTVSVVLSGTASGGALISNWQTVSDPQNGTLSGSGEARIYTPNANFYGSDSFTFRVQDSRGAWSAPAAIALTVTPVNDVPSFNLSSTALTVAKNSKVQSIAGFADAISAGPNESGQSVAFTVVSLASFFSVQPTLTPSGTLSFQVAKGRTGSTTVQLQLKDNGDTSNGGRNLSEIKNFSITVK